MTPPVQIVAAAFDQAGNPISAVTAGQPFDIAFDALFNGDAATPATSYNAPSFYVYGYGYVPISDGVGQLNGLTLTSAGSQSVSYYDYGSGLNGSLPISVDPAAFAMYSVSPASYPIVAGVPFTFGVTAEDQYGNAVPGDNGTIHFTSSDPAAILPADTPLIGGVGTFTATLLQIGSPTITATDTSASSSTPISGVGSFYVQPPYSINVSTNPYIGEVSVGMPFSFTVSATIRFLAILSAATFNSAAATPIRRSACPAQLC